MAEIGLAVAQTLFAALNCSELKEICSVWGYKSQLEDLNKTVTTVKNVFLDAESKVLSNEARGYIEELKDVVYEADDLFDESVTLLELKELKGSLSKGEKFYKKVRCFFSSNKNQVSHAYRMFHKVKKIQKKLTTIVDNHKKFALSVNYEPIIMRGKETCSYVVVKNIIGRDDDKKAIIEKLFESKNQGIRFMTIVGVGGLGKTALAQLVFSDEKLKQEFGEYRFWVCVSDQDKAQFDVKAILCKILESITGEKSFDACTMESMKKSIQEKIGGKKYLLVLDDVWNEKRKKWVDLQEFLMLGQGGSRVIVTTRSEITAYTIGDEHTTYCLQGLSPESSWNLFEMVAFDKGNQQNEELVEIGNKILVKCYNIPLAIKVVASLLYGQDISIWRSLEKSRLAEIEKDDNEIISVLKFSYHSLGSSLKRCFSYCAVFPKDFQIQRRMLISLWMAQGYIMPFREGQSIEDAAEEHFSILLRRCFFQDVKKDGYDDVKSVKIHDLMHDVAQEVGGKEIQMLSSVTNNLGDRIRHVYIIDKECFMSSSDWSKLRSLINLSYTKSLKDSLVDNWRSLRVLDLNADGKSSLGSISKLQHLRYLNLSHSSFEELSSSVTKLHNLETIILYKCQRLRQLPRDFSKLVKLRHLDLENCDLLTFMPVGMDNLTSLGVLTMFVVGKRSLTEIQCDDEMKNLGAFSNLRGCIEVIIGKNYRNVDLMKDISEGYLSKMRFLKEVRIKFNEKCIDPEVVLAKLQPHPNIKGVILQYYHGTTIPRWGRAEDNGAISLPKLVKIHISSCSELQNMPSFSKLPSLKLLELEDLDSLEYIEKTSTTNSNAEAAETTFFPSLECLTFVGLEKLKGWFWGEGLTNADDSLKRIFHFPCLSTLKICECPNLASFPPCPSVKDMTFWFVDNTSQLLMKMMGKEEGEVTVGSRSSCLATLSIYYDDKLESLAEFQKVFDICAFSLRSLEISNCVHLNRFSGGLQHLTVLESLHVAENDQLNFSEDNNENFMSWKSLHQSLRSLYFHDLENMTSLPKGMQYLTSLQTLDLQRCDELKDLPEWISCLSSLQSLVIYNCSAIESLPEGIQNLTSLQNLGIVECDKLVERCREPDGEDWSKIQHITEIDIRNSF